MRVAVIERLRALRAETIRASPDRAEKED